MPFTSEGSKLNLCKVLVQKLNGNMVANYNHGKGTSLTFSINALTTEQSNQRKQEQNARRQERLRNSAAQPGNHHNPAVSSEMQVFLSRVVNESQDEEEKDDSFTNEQLHSQRPLREAQR